MFGTPALSSPPSLRKPDTPLAEGSGLRLAGDDVAAVDSPVHALQRELARLEPPGEEGDSPREKAPGWLRVGMTLTISIMLWLVIIQIIGALWQ